MNSTQELKSGSWRWALLALAVVTLLCHGGCSRAFYRRQADADVYGLVAQKSSDPDWALDDYTIQINPASRMYDPFNPDRPPMPPDDPASHQLMHWVDGKEGWPCWHANGDTDYRYNPAWMLSLPHDESGRITLTGDEAVLAALLHSRQYQAELEELYLSALDVSFERFRFDTQFFAGYGTEFTADGPDRPGGGGESSSRLVASTIPAGSAGFRSQRLFTTGAELVVGFANSLVWEFSGPNTQSGRTLIDFNFVQPLLRQAGRARVMERLTLSERTLLANVRAMERYRKEFYVSITTGRGLGSGPARRGGVFGGAGFDSFTGLGGGFGTVVTGGTSASTGATGAADAGGYLGLLQDQLVIRNQEENIAELRESLARQEEFQAESGTPLVNEDANTFKERGLREQLQVAQARQALYDSRSRLLNSRNAYELSLDAFKSTVGMPPDVCLIIGDPILDRFRDLNDPQTQALVTRVDALRLQARELNREILASVREEKNANEIVTRRWLQWDDALRAKLVKLQSLLGEVRELQGLVAKDAVERARKDLAKLKQIVPSRVEELIRLRDKYTNNEVDPCVLLPGFSVDDEVLNIERLNSLDQVLNEKLANRLKQIGEFATQLDKFTGEFEALLAAGETMPPEQLLTDVRRLAVSSFPALLRELRTDARGIQLLQAQARTESIELPVVDVAPHDAIEIARRNRLDWMNARASLVDSWRLVQFNANDLQSGLSVVFNGDVTNLDDSPFRLKTTTGRLQVGVQFDAPLTRLAERNAYRQSLIEYQQARRNFYGFEDSIYRGLRSILRTIDSNKINFEYRRYALRVAADQITINDAILDARQGQSSGATATRDAVSALSDLLNAQNDFLGVWVNYEVLRRGLDLDLGTMRLQPDGLWCDPGRIDGKQLLEQSADYAPPDTILPEDIPPPAPLPELLPAGPGGIEFLPPPLPQP